MTVRHTHRWLGATAVALAAGGVAVIASSPALLLTAVVGVAFAAYAKMARAPPVDLDVERTLSDPNPNPGDEVTVTVSVRNAGDGVLPDLRIVDGVPGGLSVDSGSPRLGTSLRPGKRATFTYAVTATRGEHAFDPMLVLSRDFGGAVEREVTADAETVITCEPPLSATEPVPLRPQTTQYTGHVATDVGGSGVEFYATREYRPGDSLSRIDWNRHAKTGRLATLEFREERAATVVLLVDARDSAYVAAGRNEPPAVEHGVDAAGRVYDELTASGDRVGVASFGPRTCWLAPGSGREHRARVRHLLATHEAFSSVPADGPFHPSVSLRRLRKRLPDDAQVVLFAPLCDDFMADMARRIDAYGHAVTVVSPDVTATDTPGRRLARVERSLRLNELREVGIRVVDWDTAESLGAALHRARAGWSR